MLNAVVHSRALPHLVRTRSSITIADVRWLVNFEHTDVSRQESAALRERCAQIAAGGGLDALLQPAEAHAAEETGGGASGSASEQGAAESDSP